MADRRPDVDLDVNDVQKVLELLDFEASEDNINAVLGVKTFVLAAVIKSAVNGSISDNARNGLREIIEDAISRPE